MMDISLEKNLLATRYVAGRLYLCGMKANFEQISRQLLVVSLLKTYGELSADDLFEKLEKACGIRSYTYPEVRSARARMLQRDIAVISEQMYIDIKFVNGHGYRIVDSQEGAPLDYDFLFANFDLLTALQPDLKISEYILPEHHRGIGSESLFPILHAIKLGRKIDFDYVFVRNYDRVSHYSEVEPYYLKENQQRWYLVGKDDAKLKVFGLDRIKSLEISDESFKRDKQIESEEMFRHSYGIWDDPETPVEYVELKYDALDGKFLKSLPLHSSQTILVDNDEEFRISLNIKITNDFKMALLSRSRSLEVIGPTSLREYIRDVALSCSKRNN